MLGRFFCILSLAFLLGVANSTSSTAQQIDLPPNAQLNVYGNGWVCQRGFKRVGDGCAVVSMPANAQLNVYGNGWVCQRGFKRVGDGCAEVYMPTNAQLNVYGNGWVCQRGFKRVGNGCEQFTVPTNAAISPSGNDWYCVLNYKKQAESCVPMNEQEIAYQNALLAAARACGRSYNYDVEGYCDGEYVTGNVDACSNNKSVAGYIIDSNGREFEFDGEWVSKGEIEGYDSFGDYCELEVE